MKNREINTITNSNDKERDVSIDFLRFLGLSLIILAHVSPSNFILQIRTFDVPLMFFVSGLAYSGRKIDFSKSFYYHRIKRLLIPVYIFITCYYSIALIINLLLSTNIESYINDIIDSYLLIGGIGYLWIIRVFLLIGMLTPLIQWIERKIKNNKLLFLYTICWLFVWGILIETGIGYNNIIIKEYLYYAAGYSVLFLWGLRLYKSNIHTIRIFIFAIGVLFVFCMVSIIIVNNWHKYAINAYKYPPRHYYLLYGLLMSAISYLFTKKLNLKKLSSCINFIGSNTIWIYLYHIPIITLSDKIESSWVIRYIFLYTTAVTLCYIQVFISNSLSKKYKNITLFKYLKG